MKQLFLYFCWFSENVSYFQNNGSDSARQTYSLIFKQYPYAVVISFPYLQMSESNLNSATLLDLFTPWRTGIVGIWVIYTFQLTVLLSADIHIMMHCLKPRTLLFHIQNANRANVKVHNCLLTHFPLIRGTVWNGLFKADILFLHEECKHVFC